MKLFHKFSMPNLFSKKKPYELAETAYSPVFGQVSSYKTLATFDMKVDKPKYTGDVPAVTMKFYDNF